MEFTGPRIYILDLEQRYDHIISIHIEVPELSVATNRVSRLTSTPANRKNGSTIVSLFPVNCCSARVITHPPKSHWDATVQMPNTRMRNRKGLFAGNRKKHAITRPINIGWHVINALPFAESSPGIQKNRVFASATNTSTSEERICRKTVRI